MDLGLTDHVALVVGGTGLIGGAVVERLRAEDASVVVASRHPVDGSVMLDASSDHSVRAAIDLVIRDHGRIDVLVVAAAPAAQTLDQAKSSDPAQVLGAIDAKAMTFLRVANAVVPGMRNRGFGRIVVISGQNALLTGNATGTVRNAATILLAETLADELAGTGVTVNAVNPGTVTNTPHSDVQPGRGGDSTPKQVADLVAFLCSPVSALSGESVAVGHRVLGVTSLW
jgi:NAD(P)-dependent dehydrogenase (short-subunit alcohol dehydrogenase family)